MSASTTADPPAGLPPDLRLVRAPNPGPMTGPGTNTWLLGRGTVTVIDPGPAMPAHLQAIRTALAGDRVEAIIVTHAHLDHSGLAAALASTTGAPVLAFGTARAGLRPGPAAAAGLGGGEGVDHAFRPDRTLPDGAHLDLRAGPVTALHCPGHMSGHLCLAWHGGVFTGDLVLGWTTTLISPPDGELAGYRRSLKRLIALGAARYWPGHGAPVDDGPARCRDLLRHRARREAQVRAALSAEPLSLQALVARVYADTPPELHGAAARNLLAHLLDLQRRGLAAPVDRRPGPGSGGGLGGGSGGGLGIDSGAGPDPAATTLWHRPPATAKAAKRTGRPPARLL